MSWPVWTCAATLIIFARLVEQLDRGSHALFVRGATFSDTALQVGADERLLDLASTHGVPLPIN